MLKALLINTTLKKSPKESNTQALMDLVREHLEGFNIKCENIRLVDYYIAPGTSKDEGGEDEWPEVLRRIKECDILVVGSPVWVGHLCSVAQQFIERMDATFHDSSLADPNTGQYFTYNKVAGAVCTGNEDGAHEVTGHLVWAFQELGFTVPPNANSYWVGEAGPGPSMIEAGGLYSEYVQKTARFMAYNLAYFAKLLKENPIPTNLKKIDEDAKKVVKAYQKKNKDKE